MKSNLIQSSTGRQAAGFRAESFLDRRISRECRPPNLPLSVKAFSSLAFIALNLVVMPSVNADVLDSSLIVRLNFDAAPVNDVIVDTSPAGGHPGTNVLATWVASDGGRQGLMSFDGTVPNQIKVGAAPALNSPVGTIAFWLKSTNVTGSPDGYAMLMDRRTAGGD